MDFGFQDPRGPQSKIQNPKSKMNQVRLVTASPEETRRLGRRLGAAAEAGDVFLLEGPFGAGKTVLVQGLAEGLGVQGPVASPSFVIATQHRGRLPLYHVDLYRVEQLEPALLEALDEYMADQGVTVVEWAERLPEDLRREATRIQLAPAGDERREVRLSTPEERLARAAEEGSAEC
ncbi:MAG: tRNA (adenosine(37)-N6)-threonylcarbamoyltransferase complex ATPase subunit type 1 TsaE [Chloroflexi bacterium]|nr:tRNA (adenosine(37)-N6)-threonylcarbamoyltransferase complex ATPase subunit type 1 TsaE [Chloroflexota bacterium]